MLKEKNLNRFRFGFYLSLFASILAFLVIILGAYTRLTDAGLGCPDWPGCYGHWIVTKANVLQNPEIDAGKAWTEMLHRYMAGLLGLTIFGLVILAFRNRRLPQQPLALPIALGVLVIFQALLGMWTVTLKLFPLVVIAHLLGGMTTLALLWWLTLKLKSSQGVKELNYLADANNDDKKLRLWAILGLIILSIQLLLGGWTSASYSALACTDFPSCQAHLNFEWNISQALDFSTKGLTGMMNEPEDYKARMTIHMLHRFGAVLTSFMIGGLALWAFVRSKTFSLRTLSVIMASLLILQIGLGISNILALLPLSIAVAHNAVAALLLLALISFNYYLWLPQKKYA